MSGSQNLKQERTPNSLSATLRVALNDDCVFAIARSSDELNAPFYSYSPERAKGPIYLSLGQRPRSATIHCLKG